MGTVASQEKNDFGGASKYGNFLRLFVSFSVSNRRNESSLAYFWVSSSQVVTFAIWAAVHSCGSRCLSGIKVQPELGQSKVL